jgi:hypothetical protein
MFFTEVLILVILHYPNRFRKILTQTVDRFPASAKPSANWATNDNLLILFVVDNRVSKPDKFLHGHLNPLKLDGEQKEHNEKFRLSMGNSLSKQRFMFII